MEDKTAWLRRELPTVAALVDDFAAAFGRENIRVTYAKENGHEIGKRAPHINERSISLADTYVGPYKAAKRDGANRKGK